MNNLTGQVSEPQFLCSMRHAAKFLLMMLTVLAVGAAQVWGITRGYVCDCSGEPVEVESSVCEAAACHPGHDHEDDESDGPDHQHQHEEATESIQLLPVTPLTYEMPALVEMDSFEILSRGVLLARELAEHRAELKPPDDTGGNPPASELVAQTVVMLV